MPELPEVETIKNSLSAKISNKFIIGFNNFLSKIIQPELKVFRENILNSRIQSISRIGKYLFIYLNNQQVLVIHLRMTGQLLIVNKDLLPDKHTLVEFYFQDSSEKLIYRDIRRFGQIKLILEKDLLAYLASKKLAPDALLIQKETFIQNLTKRNMLIKTALLDQSIIAGIGNIYADEILFQAKILPNRRTNSLSASELDLLFTSIQQVLTLAIKNRGTSISDYVDANNQKGSNQNFLKVYKQEGKKCHNCGNLIQRIKINGRSTRYCTHCQT